MWQRAVVAATALVLATTVKDAHALEDVKPAPVDCVLSDWIFTQCNDYGMRMRERKVLVEPSGGGKPCPNEPTRQMVKCPPVNCAVCKWTEFGACDANGVKTRTRSITRPPLWGGRPCPPLVERVPCRRVDCQVCAWSDWVCDPYSGMQTRTRHVTVQPRDGGVACPHLKEEKPCDPVDCKVGDYGEWTDCDEHGHKTRTRKILQEPQYGGESCPSLVEEGSCKPEDCKTTEFTMSQDCTLDPTDGLYYKTFTRSITSPARYKGEPCGELTKRELCPRVNCEVSDYCAWSDCAEPDGRKVRTRTILQHPMYGGSECPPLEEEAFCDKVPCKMSEWTLDKDCTLDDSDNKYYKHFMRVITEHPQFGGTACEDTTKKEPCHAIDCAVGDYGEWTDCDEHGHKTRTRKILQEPHECDEVSKRKNRTRVIEVEPKYNGAPCGDLTEYRDSARIVTIHMLQEFFSNDGDTAEDALLLQADANEQGDRDGYCGKGVSRREMLSWASSVAATVAAAADVRGRGRVVALALPAYSLHETACLLAIVAQNDWVFVPVDVSLPLERQHAVLRHAAVDCVLSWRQSALVASSSGASTCVSLPALLGVRDLVCLAWSPATAAATPHWLFTRWENRQTPLYVLFTSGSTAQPKGVIGTREGTLSRLRWMWDQFPFASDDRVVRATRLSFVDAVAEILGAVLQGVPLVHVPADGTDPTLHSVVLHDPSRFLSVCSRCRVTRVTIVPSVLRVLLPAVSQGALAWRLIIVSGEPLTLDVAERALRATSATLLNLYGSTEVSGDASWFAVTSDALTSAATRARWRRLGVPIGAWPPRPVGVDTALSLVDDEMYVAGAIVAPRGYLVDGRCMPDLHGLERWRTDAFAGDRRVWFRTGDRCMVDGDELFYCGRADRRVKIRAHRVQLEDVERELLAAVRDTSDELARDATVLATTTTREDAQEENVDGGHESVLVVFLVVAQWPPSLAAEGGDGEWRRLPRTLWAAIVSRLVETVGAPYVPYDACVLHERALPRLPSGKADVRSLQAQWRRRRTSATRAEDEPGVDPHRRWVVDTLGLADEWDAIAMRSWLEVGGDSLQAAALSWRLQQHNGRRLPPEDVLSCSLRELLLLFSHASPKATRKRTRPPSPLESPAPPTRGRRPRGALSSTRVLSWTARANASLPVRSSPSSAAAARPSLRLRSLWRVDLRKCVDASPLVLVTASSAEPQVVVGSHAGDVVSVSLRSGIERWRRVLDDRVEASAVASRRFGLVLVGTHSGGIFALDAASGAQRWCFRARDAIKAAALVLDAADLVVVGAYDHTLYGLALSGGGERWRIALPGSVFSTPAVTASGLLVVATTTGHVLGLALRPDAPPQTRWSTPLPAPVFSSLVAVADLVLVGCVDGVLYALEAVDGTVRWKVSTRGAVVSTPSVVPTGDGDGPAVVLSSHDGALYRVAAGDGALCWTCATGDAPLFASPFVALDG
ncbi:hypothetical protein ATCC90586_007017 [Pythium insidiosum]|nr:hypothetical protein ATCC90586_007017 [Pythium insidiosum]